MFSLEDHSKFTSKMDDVKKLCEEVKDLMKGGIQTEEEIKRMNEINVELQKNGQKIDAIDSIVAELNSKADEIKKDTGAIKTDTGAIKKDTSTLLENQAHYEAQMDEVLKHLRFQSEKIL